MKRREEYLVLAAGLGLVAAIANWAWPRPTDGFVLNTGVDMTIQEYVPAPADKATFPARATVSKNRLVSGEFETVLDVNLLPNVVKEFYRIGKRTPKMGMANPGDEFNPSDVIDDKVPNARLIFAATRRSDNFWIIYYEFGGRVYSSQANFLTFTPDSVTPVWRCYLYPPAENLETLLNKVRNGDCNFMGNVPRAGVGHP